MKIGEITENSNDDELEKLFENNFNTSNGSTNNSTSTNGKSKNNSSNSGYNSYSSKTKSVKYKGYDVIGIIEIPKTKIKNPIIKESQLSTASLKVAICNLHGELNAPKSNCILVGHNFRNGTFFSNNKKLSNGDKIYITDSSGKKVTYIVYKKYETTVGDFDYAVRKIGTKREISLSTCTDDAKKRLIVLAKEE